MSKARRTASLLCTAAGALLLAPDQAQAAALALGFVGTAIGGSIGGTILGVSTASFLGFVGSTIGGLIDNMLFAGTQKVEGPRLDDLSVTASTYGAPIPLLFGPQVRVAGNIIWSTGLIETVHREKQGGKGGPSVETTTYTYRVSLAIAFGEGEVHSIKRIWANSKLIFNIDDATTPPDDPTDEVGMVATKANGTHAVFDTLRFYQGNGTQTADPTIESYLGTGETPAYRHTCYMVLTDLQLADFGNVIPNIEVELQAHESITVGETVKDICKRAGVDEVSAYGLRDELKGYVVSRAGTVVAAIEPLALAYKFDAAEQGGQIRCVTRGGPMRGVISQDDMGAFEAGNGDPIEPIRFERKPDMLLPEEASITFADPDLDFQNNTQRARRLLGSSENNLSHEIPITLTADEGRQIADRLLYEAWSARRTAKFPVSDKWSGLRPADIIGIPAASDIIPFKIERATRGANGVIQCEARFEDPEIYTSQAKGTAGNIPANNVKFPGETKLVLIDMPIGRALDDDAGFYWAAVGTSAGWRGATILRSSDSGTTYDRMASVAVRAGIGTVADALPAGPAEVWDRGNTLTVVLDYEGEQLESVSELHVLNGANAFWLGPSNGRGGEVIQFATATLTDTKTYVLSDLLRGRLGTEHAIGNHGANEVFVLLDSAIGRSDFGAGDWNRARLYKPVSVLTSEADTDSQSFTNTGEGKRPYSPVHVRGSRDESDNLTITWIRRSRLPAPGLGNGPVPLGEVSEAYEVDILAGSPPAVVRTIETTSAQASYTAAQQTADGITPGDSITVRVYQISDVRGRGHPAEATI